MPQRNPEDEAWFVEQFERLTPDRLRHLLRLGAAWDRFCTQMHHRLTAKEAGRGGAKDGSDDPEQFVQQWQAVYLLGLYSAMGAPAAASDVPKRLLAAFEHRRAGISDSLFAINHPAGANRPTSAMLKFRAFAVRAAVVLRESGLAHSMDDAFVQVKDATAWIAKDATILARVGRVPTAGAIQGWHEDIDKDVRLGRLYAGLSAELPPELSGRELATWLVTAISASAGKAFSP